MRGDQKIPRCYGDYGKHIMKRYDNKRGALSIVIEEALRDFLRKHIETNDGDTLLFERESR